MLSHFSKNIAAAVRSEVTMSKQQEFKGNFKAAFQHLENAHVLGQESTWWHVKVHGLMFCWAVRQLDVKECIGQLIRIVGAATKTAIGLVPTGNTGGSNISPFKRLPIRPEHQLAINKAKVRL